MPPPPVRARPHGLTFAVLLALACLTAAAFFLAPHVQRWRIASRLTAVSLSQREPALAILGHRAPSDDRLVAAAVAVLPEADDANFLQIVRVLDRAEAWSAYRVPTPTWGRWLRLLAGETDEATRVFAAQQLGVLRELADQEGTVTALSGLLGDASPTVRYHALINTASLAGVAGNSAPFHDLLRAAALDGNPRIARHAWISMGLLRTRPLPPLTWQAAPPDVAEAMLWAAMQSNPDDIAPVVAALTDPQAGPYVRAAAVYALHHNRSDAATTALLDAADVPAEAINAANQRVVWRAILGLPRPDLVRRDLTRLEEVVAAPAWDEGSDPLIEPLALASVYRMGIAGARRQVADYFAYDDLRKLATVEGQEPPFMYWPVTGQKPPILRVMTVAVSRDPRLSDLLPAFASPSATMRDLACVVGVDRFDDTVIDAAIAALLDSGSADTRKSAALLAGLSGLQREALDARMDVEPDQATRAVLRLAQCMDPRVDLRSAAAHAALHNAAAPPSTSVLVLLARGDLVAGLDRLFNPHGEPRLDLVQTLGSDRWWHVLKRYLPPASDPPPFWVWGDRDVQRFQVDVLRDWYLVNRLRWAQDAPAPAPAAERTTTTATDAASSLE